MFKKYSYTLIAIFSLLIACSSPEQILAESVSSEAGITFSNSDVSPTTNPNKPDDANIDANKNIKSGILPKTGGETSNLFQIIGFFILSIALVMLVTKVGIYKGRRS
ncbi:LPXTG cell wall anchor domain-containing protein [Bacillus paranthracis]|uniref:LPXTG cell wall anchor domain-containing protein n=1 Tax=Bacillus paranthracis TaxID=2026186 RepID=UPI000772263C|nr:LPXTG cell wall anchor domain-containing protein [Bacillus paranthracis]KXI73407.1 hypothetical protein ACS52_25770 [Bacillus cereus]KXY03194.1 hypothetical protein AT271_05115 [Bacillus cereus]MCC2439018.1 LPXTG cell wall anchor domain-containing protein [Bacillus paranthracis]MDG1605165.1 LPXTG cell wall anchor domain-containing protein [Bacillus paranthracis]